MTIKSCFALFISFSTKAVHLELVSDLSSEAFLASSRQFIARGWLSSDVYGGNSTNFEGACKYLIKVVRANTVQIFSNNLQISLLFIHPVTPHFGGL